MRTEQFLATAMLEGHVTSRSGSVSVETHDGAEIVVELDSANDELVQAVEVEHRTGDGGDRLIVRVPRDLHWGRQLSRSHDLDITIRVPEAGIMRIETASAEVSLAGAYRKTTVTTASGDVRYADCTGDALVTTASGDIDLRRLDGSAELRTASGSVSANSISGEATLKSASGDIGVDRIGGPVSASTASGDISVGAPAGCRASTASGDVTIRGVQSGNVEAKTVSGDVTVSVMPGVAVQVDATSMTGSLNSEIDLSTSDATSSVDGGRPVKLSLRSLSGDVLVRRSREAIAV